MLGSNIGSYCPQGPTLWPIWPEISWSGDVWPGFFALPSRFVQVKNWLVVSTYPSEKWWSSSMGRMTSHIWNGKSKPCLKPPTRKYLPFGKPPFSRTSPDTLSWHPTVKSYTWWRHFWTLGHGRKVPRHHSFRTFGRELRTTPQIKQEILNFLVLAWPSTFHNHGHYTPPPPRPPPLLAYMLSSYYLLSKALAALHLRIYFLATYPRNAY